MRIEMLLLVNLHICKTINNVFLFAKSYKINKNKIKNNYNNNSYYYYCYYTPPSK